MIGDGTSSEELRDAVLKTSGRERDFTSPGGTFGYLLQKQLKNLDRPANLILLFLPKNADLATLKRLYPKEKTFSFSDEEAKRLLAESVLPQNEIGDYIELLHRGGAFVFTRKNGTKAYLSVQPERRLSLHAMKLSRDPDPLLNE
jgi:hypothetical protein